MKNKEPDVKIRPIAGTENSKADHKKLLDHHLKEARKHAAHIMKGIKSKTKK